MGTLSGTADALVIGGGPAGSAAAVVLARSGADTVVLERDRIATAKVCGEFLSVEACEEARALGVDPFELGAAPIDRVRVTCGATTAESRLPFRAASVSRYLLDEALLAAASAAGARVERGARAIAIDGSRVTVRTDEGTSQVDARSVVLATGKSELCGLRRTESRLHDSLGFKMHLVFDPRERDALGSAVELTLFQGGYAGMQRIEGDLVALAIVVRRDTYARLGSWRALVAAVTSGSKRIARRLENACELWPKPLAVSGVPYGFTYHDDATEPEPGFYRVGDQLAVIPSFTGDGLAIALVTGTSAAEAIVRAEAPRAFHAAMRARLASPMRVAGMLSQAISSPLGRAAVVWPARVLPTIFARFAEATRISRRER
jgi:flavin-dependent dehydrogenase